MNKLKVVFLLAAGSCALSLSLSACGSPEPSTQTTQDSPPATADVTETKPVDVAKAGLSAYCSTDLAQDEWKAGLVPYLSERGRSVYVNTDVSQISDCTVGEPVGDPETDGNLLQYIVIDTDAGEWRVTVARTAENDPWRVDAFTPPPEPGGTQPAHTDNSQPDY